ncbi:serine/threonine protein kinase [Streptomyces sp. Y1]|uniref:non-specific serine/threonine protein kinase n=1 Tax=Streptomyces sp. Y1 TaxID=3238634 RepID=A0AB39TEN7_9ACTN
MIGSGTVLNVRYRLIERLGRGGMGEVWRAHDSVLARKVAVKILNAELFDNAAAIESFRREAQLVAAIDHPGVVKVHDYGETGVGVGAGVGAGVGVGENDGDGDSHGDGEGGGGDTGDRCAYIVMDLIDGRPLNQVLEAEGRMPPERALGMVAAALDALHAAHQRSIVHRDIKPSNLMVRRSDDAVVVTDFGIALAIAGTKATKRSGVIGTAAYMSPEQAVNGRIGPASDLYSIGVVCYELLVGRLPFVGDGPVQVAIKHVHEPVPDLPKTVPAAVRELVVRALAKAPEDRFASAAEMAAAARAAVGLPPGSAADTGTVDLRGKAAAAVPAPVPAADADPAAKARPAVKAEPVLKVDPDRPTEPVRRRSRRTLLVPIIIPAVISVGTATALLIDRSPGSSNASAPPDARQTVAATAPATPGGAAPDTATAATTAPTGTPGATQPGQQPATPDQGQPPQPQQPGTAAGAAGGAAAQPGRGGNAGGSGGGSGNGGQGGGAAGGGTAHQPAPAPAPANPANPANPNPQPPPQNSSGGPSSGGSSGAGGNPPPAQTSDRPSSCGGSSWTKIVSASSGAAIGLANDNLDAGNPVVLGGHAQYGWVVTTGSWNEYRACNSGGPNLVFGFLNDDSVGLGDVFSIAYRWTVQSAGSGTYTLGDGTRCMTSNGAGQRVTMQTCTKGLAAQQWRFQ